jgi:hypothetical protein
MKVKVTKELDASFDGMSLDDIVHFFTEDTGELLNEAEWVLQLDDIVLSEGDK